MSANGGRLRIEAGINRRQWLASLGALGLAGCAPAASQAIPGGLVGVQPERGHGLRPYWQRLAQGLELPAPAQVHRVPLVIAGGGMAGLAAAGAVEQAGLAGAALLDSDTAMGGNSRAGSLGGLACPLGAHYLPLPGEDAPEVQDWLEQLGLRQRVAGRWQYDERHLCHSPQERLFFQGSWQEGLLPMQGVGADTLDQYQRFSAAIAREMANARFAMPALRLWRERSGLAPRHAQLDSLTMAEWLAEQGLHDRYLRWYLDYACRDDFGAGCARISAWAGVHYFGSRHGFAAPELSTSEGAAGQAGEQVLTWAEGNGWLAGQLVRSLAQTALVTDCSVLAITEGADQVQVDAFHHGRQQHERWLAPRCVLALPSWIAARVLRNPPDFLRQVAARLDWAPWMVANIQLDRPLADRPGAEPAWDNVLFDDPNPGGLGYVDAGHQRLDRLTQRPTVLTYYQALGDLAEGRAELLRQPFEFWRDRIATSLALPHPDLGQRASRMEITRYGHAMAIPRPGDQQLLSRIALQSSPAQGRRRWQGESVALLPTPGTRRIAFAHSDWAGYSVLEEAFTRGHHAGLWARQ